MQTGRWVMTMEVIILPVNDHPLSPLALRHHVTCTIPSMKFALTAEVKFPGTSRTRRRFEGRPLPNRFSCQPRNPTTLNKNRTVLSASGWQHSTSVISPTGLVCSPNGCSALSGVIPFDKISHSLRWSYSPSLADLGPV